MSRALFPAVTPQDNAAAGSSGELPMCRDVMWDYQLSKPVFRRGAPVLVEGIEAVKSWAYRALMVVRYRNMMYSTDFGNEADSLIGQAYSGELKAAEAMRYVREALMIYPYITDVRDIGANFADGVLQVNCMMETIYGEVRLSV